MGQKCPGVLPDFFGSFLAHVRLFFGSLSALARLFSQCISHYYSALSPSSLRSFRFSFCPCPAFLPAHFSLLFGSFFVLLALFPVSSSFFKTFLRFSSYPCPAFLPAHFSLLFGSFFVLFLAVLCPFGSGIFLHKLLFCQAADHHVISLHGNTVHSSPSQYGFFPKTQSVQYLT